MGIQARYMHVSMFLEFHTSKWKTGILIGSLSSPSVQSFDSAILTLIESPLMRCWISNFLVTGIKKYLIFRFTLLSAKRNEFSCSGSFSWEGIYYYRGAKFQVKMYSTESRIDGHTNSSAQLATTTTARGFTYHWTGW